MARVVIVFEDTIGGPLDGSSHIHFESDPPIIVTDGNMPVLEKLTLAQKQSLIAIGAVNECFHTLESGVTKLTMPDEATADSEEPLYGD